MDNVKDLMAVNINTSVYGAILVLASVVLSLIILSYTMPEYGWRSPVYRLGAVVSQT